MTSDHGVTSITDRTKTDLKPDANLLEHLGHGVDVDLGPGSST